MRYTRYKSTRLIAFLVVIVVATFGCGGRVNLSNLTADQLFQHGKEKYQKKKYIRAIEAFQAVVYNYPGATLVDTAQYYLALSYFGQKDYILAGAEFNRLANNYPASTYFEHALFMRAVCFFEGTPHHYGLDQTDLETAIRQFEDFLIDYPESELLPDAQKYLLEARSRKAKKFYSNGVVYEHMGAYNAAEAYFQKVIDDYTDTEFGPRATFMRAEMLFKSRKYDKARGRFADFITVFPVHEWVPKAIQRREESTFKAGEAAARSGDTARALELFELFINEYPQSKRFDKANERLGELRQPAAASGGSEDADS
ncbi:MAG: outer membrane protein assembly factor BamD [Candidatus Zixiibacteriota bacterium]